MKNKRGQDWTNTDINKLRELAKMGRTTKSIAKGLGRTPYAIYSKASEKNITLKPKDK